MSLHAITLRILPISLFLNYPCKTIPQLQSQTAIGEFAFNLNYFTMR